MRRFAKSSGCWRLGEVLFKFGEVFVSVFPVDLAHLPPHPFFSLSELKNKLLIVSKQVEKSLRGKNTLPIIF